MAFRITKFAIWPYVCLNISLFISVCDDLEFNWVHLSPVNFAVSEAIAKAWCGEYLGHVTCLQSLNDMGYSLNFVANVCLCT